MVQEGSKEAFVECLEMDKVFFICHSTELYFPKELLSFLITMPILQIRKTEALSDLPQSHKVVSSRTEHLI